MKKITVKNTISEKLYDELVAAGFPPLLMTNDQVEGEILSENTWIMFEEDADMVKVNRIIGNHDLTPSLKIKSDAELLGQEASEREIQEIIQGQQISDLDIRLIKGGL